MTTTHQVSDCGFVPTADSPQPPLSDWRASYLAHLIETAPVSPEVRAVMAAQLDVDAGSDLAAWERFKVEQDWFRNGEQAE